jgi:O-methyltransferase/methyltransferase family protein
MATQIVEIPTTIQAPPPAVFLTELAFGMKMTQALYVTAKLGIADLLCAGPRHVSQLAAATETSERSLYRVLRSLAAVGIFRETDPRVFDLTPYAEALRSNVPNSFRNGAIFMGEEWLWNVMGQMLYSVKTGKSAWARVHGSDAFEYLAKNPDHHEIFNRAMTEMTMSAAPAIVEAYDFSPFKTIVDIAGGHGYLLSQILKATPKLRGVLFDVEPVIAGAGTILEEEAVTDKVDLVAGNFFESVPSGADAYIMKHIIHDWDDELSNKILRNIARAMTSHAKLLIVEMVVPEGNEPHFSKVMDLGMLVLPGGVERTLTEYHTLLADAGLSLHRTIPTQTPLSIIEAVKA